MTSAGPSLALPASKSAELHRKVTVSQLSGLPSRRITMDFGLSDEQLALQETARRFAQQEIAPQRRPLRPDRRVPARDHPQGLGARALERRRSPTEYGGVGLSARSTAASWSRSSPGAAPGMATSIMCNDLGLTPILVGGSEEQKKRVARPLTPRLHAGLLLPLRARRRLRRRRPPAPRREGRRPLRAERHQVLDHQRRRGRPLHRLRHPRPREPPQGHLRLRRSPRETPRGHARARRKTRWASARATRA